MKYRYIIGLFAVQLFILLVDIILPLRLPRLYLESIVNPLQLFATEAFGKVSNSVEFIASLDNVYGENEQLKRRIAALREQEAINTQLLQENERLRQQFKNPLVNEQTVQPASIIGFDYEQNALLVVIDSGEKQGVTIDDLVVSGQSLVGRVVRTNPSRSWVQPVIANSSRVPVYVQKDDGTRLAGLVSGRFNTSLELEQVIAETPVEVGDYVFTSGIEGTYLAGLLIGEVAEIEEDTSGVFQRAVVSMLWDLRQISTVFVVT